MGRSTHPLPISSPILKDAVNPLITAIFFYYSSEDSTVPNHGDFSPLIRLLTWNDISGAASEVMHARTRLTTHGSTASTSTPQSTAGGDSTQAL